MLINRLLIKQKLCYGNERKHFSKIKLHQDQAAYTKYHDFSLKGDIAASTNDFKTNLRFHEKKKTIDK